MKVINLFLIMIWGIFAQLTSAPIFLEDNDFVIPAGMNVDTLEAIYLGANKKDIVVIVGGGDSINQGSPVMDVLLSFDVKKHRQATLHLGNNLTLIGVALYTFTFQKTGWGKRVWKIEPGNSFTLQPNVVSSAPIDLFNHITWKGKRVYNIQDQNLLFKDDIELPEGDIIIEAKHENITIRADHPLVVQGSSKGTTRIYFHAHKNRTITILADRTMQFLANNHQLFFIEEGCGTVRWIIPPTS